MLNFINRPANKVNVGDTLVYAKGNKTVKLIESYQGHKAYYNERIRFTFTDDTQKSYYITSVVRVSK